MKTAQKTTAAARPSRSSALTLSVDVDPLVEVVRRHVKLSPQATRARSARCRTRRRDLRALTAVIPVVADADTLFGATTRGLLIHIDYRGLIRLHWGVLPELRCDHRGLRGGGHGAAPKTGAILGAISPVVS